MRQKFQSTRPLRGATNAATARVKMRWNFNPRAPYGARRCRRRQACTWSDFNPRAPCGARRRQLAVDVGRVDISTHVPRAGHDPVAFAMPFTVIVISTHVPRAGHDCGGQRAGRIPYRFQPTCPVRGTTRFRVIQPPSSPISTHVPRAGHDEAAVNNLAVTVEFQPTCPVRGTT